MAKINYDKITIMEGRLQKLEEEIAAIKARNARVEKDKAWETSKTRTLFIALTSFILIYIVMRQVGADYPFFNALISSIVYVLSTSSYGILKRWWLTRRRNA